MALLEFANGFRSFGYLQISFAFFLIILSPLPAASDAIPLFFPGCLIVGGGGRGGAALQGRGWRCGGGAGRTGIGRDGADRDGLVWETVRLSEEGRGGGGAFLLTFVGPDLVLLLRHEAFWGLSSLVSAPAFASFFFSWFPTTPDNGAREAALASVVASLKQAAPLVTSPSRFSFRKLFKDPGRDNFLLSSLSVRLDNYEGIVNSCNLRQCRNDSKSKKVEINLVFMNLPSR